MARELLVLELRGLRKGRGLSRHRLALCPNVKVGYEELVAEVRALGDGLHARALQNAFALDMSDPQTLTFRRNSFAAENARSADTIEAYENEMIEELAERVMANAENLPEEPDYYQRRAEYLEDVLYEVMEALVAKYGSMGDRLEAERSAFEPTEEQLIAEKNAVNGMEREDFTVKQLAYLNALTTCLERIGIAEGEERWDEGFREALGELHEFLPALIAKAKGAAGEG